MLFLNKKRKNIKNMLTCLLHHPAIKEKKHKENKINILVGWDKEHKNIAEDVIIVSSEFPTLNISSLSLELTSSDTLVKEIECCDLYVFFYLSSTLKPFKSLGPDFLSAIRKVMRENWRKSVLFKDYGEHFYEAFSEELNLIKDRNNFLISLANSSKKVIYQQDDEHMLTATFSENQSWTSIDGIGNYDLTPGEIATKLHNLEGSISFSGAFLSTIPFAIKYGVVSNFFNLTIKNSKIIDFTCQFAEFSKDFDKYLSTNSSNSTIEEFGIGTNCGVEKLYGLNAGFEERHPGLHLGLGGGEVGSHHLDLIFQGGKLFFGNTIVLDNNKFII
ncbi:leucyl aminopeptidase [Xenorhabdus sp. PB61.4]|uniref:leucyl aminopeptidase n=1 Tax=Xenorhabdus sp. PB61.4 TaxID=2788940 RepID=UPI001E4AFA57|nr:leucyl aminopeptidase [Xenorhabdus sp. PB61.4]MCC8368323.1 leucyl aminopeptidase [Xenorhabdus sp. PB61.4]